MQNTVHCVTFELLIHVLGILHFILHHKNIVTKACTSTAQTGLHCLLPKPISLQHFCMPDWRPFFSSAEVIISNNNNTF